MRTLTGVVLVILSALNFALLSFVVKAYLQAVPVNIILLNQSFIGLLLMIPLIIKRYGIKALNIFAFSKVNKLHITRAIFSVGISFFMFLSLKYISFMDSVLIYNLNPFLVPFTAWLILKDKVNHYLWPFILLGFIGVSLTLKVDSALFSLPVFFALASAVCVTVSVVMIRKILAVDGGLKSLYYFFIYASLITLIMVLLIDIRHTNFMLIIYNNYYSLIIIGVLYFFTQISLIYSGKFVKPAIVACTFYTNIIFSLVLSYLFLNGGLTIKIILGCTLIIAGGIGVIYMQSQKSKH